MFMGNQNGKVFKRSLLVALIMNATIAQANSESVEAQVTNTPLSQATTEVQSVKSTLKNSAETAGEVTKAVVDNAATSVEQAKTTVDANVEQAVQAAKEGTVGTPPSTDENKVINQNDATATVGETTEQANDETKTLANVMSSEEQMDNLLRGVKGVTNKSLLTNIYAKRDFKPIWTNELAEEQFMRNYVAWAISNVSPQANQLLSTISQLPSNSNPMLKDVLLSDAFLNYLYYQDNLAKKSEQWLYGNSNYIVGKPSSSSVNKWIAAVDKNSALSYMRSIQPSNQLYQNAVDKIMVMLPKGNNKVSVTFNQSLKPGNSSSQLANLVKILKTAGVLAQDYKLTDNKYSGELVKSVKAFQKKNGLTADGIIGSNTLAIMNNNPTKQLYKLAINAQRLRLLPNFNNGIFVNIPTYYLNFYKNGKNIFESRVIVGRDERKTPVMQSRLSNVVINPPWNAPTRLINEDIIPKVRRDPSYIYRHGYQIINGRGRVIDPYTIDWENMTAENFPYRLRQSAGGKNGSALGHYKFNMPSKDAIYLHDTPHKGLFSRSSRALSSGCVRVQRSDDLAELLVKQVGWSAERKDAVLQSKKTVSVNVKRDPVYLYYVTSWVENGKVHNVADIYDWDRSFSKTKIDWNNIRKLMN